MMSNPNAINFSNASAATAYALFPFDKAVFLAKVGYWLERGYNQTVGANGKLTSWGCRYTATTASMVTATAPTVAPDGSARGDGTQWLEIPAVLNLQAQGASGAGLHLFARVKTSGAATSRAVAGHWASSANGDWILLANNLASAVKGSFVINDSGTVPREGLTSGDASTGSFVNLEGVWSGAGTNIVASNDGMSGAGVACAVSRAAVTGLQAQAITVFRYSMDATFNGFLTGDIAALLHFTAPLTTNEAYYVRAYLMGLN